MEVETPNVVKERFFKGIKKVAKNLEGFQLNGLAD